MTQLVLPENIKKVIGQMKKHGYNCYVVGGFVRDSLLKLDPKTQGVDFATNATPDQIMAIYPQAKYENRFGTVIVPIGNKNFFEITTFRTEKNYKDRRHPEKVIWGKTLKEDLKRRDFTINALAYDGKKLIDLFDGLIDLNNKIIRTIGNPNERFEEDALRLMRAIRFSCVLDFEIEEKTKKAILKNNQLIKQISMERIRDEFLKILASNSPKKGVIMLKELGLLKHFLPELVAAFDISQVSKERHHIYDVGTHSVNALEACKNPDPIVRLASLLHDIGKTKTRDVNKEGIVTFYNHEIVGTDMAYEIGQRLKLSKKEVFRLTKLVRFHQFTVSETQSDKAILRFIRNVGKENLQDIIDLRLADRIGSGAKPSSWRTELFLTRLKKVQEKPFLIKDLKINGIEVMRTLKIKPGPKVGEILTKIFELVNDGKLENTKKDLLKYLKTLR